MLKKIAVASVIFLVHPIVALGLGAGGTRVEVEKFFDTYLAAFAARDKELVAEKYFVAPIYLRTGSEMLLLESREKVREHLTMVFSALSDQNYSRTEIVTKNTCILTDDAAIVSVALKRYSSEGVVLLESAASYSIVKLDGIWRISMASVHTPEAVLSCQK